MGTCGPCVIELASLARQHSSAWFSTRRPYPCAPQDVALDYIGKRGSTIGATKETRMQYARELLQVTAAVLCGAGLDDVECAVAAVEPVTSRLRADGLVVCSCATLIELRGGQGCSRPAILGNTLTHTCCNHLLLACCRRSCCLTSAWRSFVRPRRPTSLATWCTACCWWRWGDERWAQWNMQAAMIGRCSRAPSILGWLQDQLREPPILLACIQHASRACIACISLCLTVPA